MFEHFCREISNVTQVNEWIKETIGEREKLVSELAKLPVVTKIYPSDANFILVKTTDARGIYEHLVKDGIIVRDRSRVILCEGCLRITIGKKEENKTLLNALQNYK